MSGTPYHATSNLRCNINGTAAECPFGVERIGQGEALVTITRPDKISRVIYFGKGKVSWSDQSQAEKNVKFQSSQQGDTHLIQLGNEHYEIPDAVIFGG
ncbi:hypothetical protein HQ393_12550 [Chitinibacter bivalviorum]|uniref:Uncharacterized protein n=1 Tax=Chitinibacter bivalviorum TaxID=2739434 RepID=A0A7H9BK13_9NEIS|nr:hypothetical protein [Chitinibacter bivalviorum]QLG89000.1 hypothetical protein HQ393_12550 [Chitinibacter bivalviorum]